MEYIKIFITPTLLSKLDILSSDYSIEIGGYLIGEIKNKSVYLKDILFPTQAISLTHVDISPTDQLELRSKYGVEKVKQIIGHWHSHHSMGAFFSGTDNTQHQNGMQYRDFFVYIVSSQGRHKAKVCISNPICVEIESCQLVVWSKTLEMMKNRVNRIIKEQQSSLSEWKNEESDTKEESDSDNNKDTYDKTYYDVFGNDSDDDKDDMEKDNDVDIDTVIENEIKDKWEDGSNGN